MWSSLTDSINVEIPANAALCARDELASIFLAFVSTNNLASINPQPIDLKLYKPCMPVDSNLALTDSFLRRVLSIRLR